MWWLGLAVGMLLHGSVLVSAPIYTCLDDKGGVLLTNESCPPGTTQPGGRVDPDGSTAEYIPQKQPARPQLTPCGGKLGSIRSLKEARMAYRDALQQLKAQPTNPDCHEYASSLDGSIGGWGGQMAE